MKPIFRTLLYAALSCALIANVIYVLYMTKKVNQLSCAFQAVEKIRWENTLLKEGFFHTYDYEGTTIDYSANITNAKGKPIILKDLLRGKCWLLLFMQVGLCRNCLFDNVEFIKKAKKENVNVLVGVSGLTEKEFRIFVQQYNLEDIAYRLPKSFFDRFDLNPIVYFVVDKSLRCKYFYAPSIVFPGLTKDYFDVIMRKVSF